MIKLETVGIQPQTFYVYSTDNRGFSDKTSFRFSKDNDFCVEVTESQAEYLLKAHPSMLFIAGTIKKFKGFSLLESPELSVIPEKISDTMKEAKTLEISINTLLDKYPQQSESFISSDDVSKVALFLAKIKNNETASAEGLKDIKYLKENKVETFFNLSDYIKEPEPEEDPIPDVEQTKDKEPEEDTAPDVEQTKDKEPEEDTALDVNQVKKQLSGARRELTNARKKLEKENTDELKELVKEKELLVKELEEKII